MPSAGRELRPPPRVAAVLLLAAAAACTRWEPAPVLEGVVPALAAADTGAALAIHGRHLVHVKADFDQPQRSGRAPIHLWLEDAQGGRLELTDVRVEGEGQLSARLEAPAPAGEYALRYESAGREALLERALTLTADAARVHCPEPVACDGPDGDLCLDDWPACEDGVPVCSAGPTNTERCDGLDNDCNGATPDGLDEPGVGGPCDGPDTDLCADDVLVCAGGGLACSTGEPNPEACDGLDNDCDPASADGTGEPDLGTPCDGADSDTCAEGVWACSGGGMECMDTSGDGCPPALAVGTFVVDGSGATQQVVPHALGAVPGAALLWSAGAADESPVPDLRLGVGFTDGSLASLGAAAHSRDGALVSSASRRLATSALSLIQSSTLGPATVEAEARMRAWSEATFTLDWTVPARRRTLVHYLLVGGPDVRAKVVRWRSRSSPGRQAVSGVGFRPDVVLHLHASSSIGPGLPDTGNLAILGLGAMAAPGEEWAAMLSSMNAAAVTNTQRGLRPSALFSFWDDLSVGLDAHLVSLDADGFTLDFASASSATAAEVLSLALAGVQGRLGCLSRSSTALPVEQEGPRVGMRPQALLLAGVHLPPRTGPASHARLSLGATDGQQQASVSVVDVDAQLVSRASSVSRTAAAYVELSGAGSVDAQASLVRFEPDGFRLRWEASDAPANEVCYLALGAR